MVGENKKVKNAKKVDINGALITDLKKFREETPEAVYFDSKLEHYCYKQLETSGIDFIYKPDKVEITPKMEALDWEYDKEQLRNLRDLQRGVKNRVEKAANTRYFNANNSKSLTLVKLPAWTWSPDFDLPELNIFIDTKGNKKDAAWRNKLKAARQLLEPKGKHVIQLQTKKEITEFINYIQNEH